MKYYCAFFTETEILLVFKGAGRKVSNKVLQSFLSLWRIIA